MEADMHISIAPFPAVPAELDRELSDGPQATTFDVVVDFATVESTGTCCGGGAGGCSDTPNVSS
jgi:hypothetical protein